MGPTSGNFGELLAPSLPRTGRRAGDVQAGFRPATLKETSGPAGQRAHSVKPPAGARSSLRRPLHSRWALARPPRGAVRLGGGGGRHGSAPGGPELERMVEVASSLLKAFAGSGAREGR